MSHWSERRLRLISKLKTVNFEIDDTEFLIGCTHDTLWNREGQTQHLQFRVVVPRLTSISILDAEQNLLSQILRHDRQARQNTPFGGIRPDVRR